MKRHRSRRSDDARSDDGAVALADDEGPVLDRRRFLTFAALGTGAAVTGFGLAKYVLNGDAATASTAAASSSAATGATGATTAASSASSTSTTAAATEVADEVAFGVGDVTTDRLSITVADGYRNIVTASYSTSHDIDPDFRYPGTPAPQEPGYTYQVTTDPQIADSPTFVQTGQVFGVHLDSVVWDPKTAGYYNNDMNGGWNYVATADTLDVYGAHTRPETGFYHYHAVTEQWISDTSVHSDLVGWAADGFPVYLRYGYTDPSDPSGGVTNLQPSYQLKSGSRPSGSSDPGGTYDGTFVADYEYVEGLGDLDECNGRECLTPEFPDGTYAYFLTDAWPWVPTYLRGTPDASFAPGFGGGSGLPQGA